jgi:DNA-binding transcriptional MocR family regulator
MSPTQTGMNAIGWLPCGSDDTIARQKIEKHGILSSNMSYYYNEQQAHPGLYLGFCCTPVEKMRPAVQKMAKALDI